MRRVVGRFGPRLRRALSSSVIFLGIHFIPLISIYMIFLMQPRDHPTAQDINRADPAKILKVKHLRELPGSIKSLLKGLKSGKSQAESQRPSDVFKVG